jgi:hypothetical protein
MVLSLTPDTHQCHITQVQLSERWKERLSRASADGLTYSKDKYWANFKMQILGLRW